MCDTPCIMIDKARLIQLVDRFQELGRLFYPVKANAYPGIIQLLKDKNASFNVSAVYYLDILLKQGVSSESILWDNCFCSDSDLDYVIQSGVKIFTADSTELIHQILDKCPEAEILIKISNAVIAESPYKFGSLNPESLIREVPVDHLRGIAFHLGKDLFDHHSLRQMLEYIRNLGSFRTVNIGGGYEDLFEDPRVPELLKKYKAEGGCQELFFEPGRGLLNTVCSIYTRVVALRKHNGQNWARIDASIYSGLMDLYIEEKNYRITDQAKETCPYLILGYTPDSGDCFGVHELSAELKLGDLLQIHHCGAYSFDMSCKYSGAKQLHTVFI